MNHPPLTEELVLSAWCEWRARQTKCCIVTHGEHQLPNVEHRSRSRLTATTLTSCASAGLQYLALQLNRTSTAFIAVVENIRQFRDERAHVFQTRAGTLQNLPHQKFSDFTSQIGWSIIRFDLAT